MDDVLFAIGKCFMQQQFQTVYTVSITDTMLFTQQHKDFVFKVLTTWPDIESIKFHIYSGIPCFVSTEPDGLLSKARTRKLDITTEVKAVTADDGLTRNFESMTNQVLKDLTASLMSRCQIH